MLEWVATITSLEVGKWALEQGLKLAQGALEDYVKDFFKDCIKNGVALAKPSALKQPVQEAIGLFIKRFVKELQMNDVPDTSIEHHYKSVIKRFVRDKAVLPILGKAFEKDCKKIDYDRLQDIWTETYQDDGWQFPSEEFDWRSVAKEYVHEVKNIIKATPELRSLLEIGLQEETAETLKQIAGLQVKFDLANYAEAILEQYGMLQLDSLGSSKYEREGVNYRIVSLWDVFVAQDARSSQDYLPQSYEIPKEELKRLHELGEIEAIAEEEAQRRRERYFQQTTRSVLEIVGAKEGSAIVQPPGQYVVVLGDPGSGKSTLLRYLSVNWAQQRTEEQIPLLIELRRYMQSKENNECRDFVEFVHRGSNWVGHLDQTQLDEWLNAGKVLVMFDGLDEVVDRQQRGTVITQIHSFTQRYPSVPVIVTSRVIGYNPEQLRNAGFQHFLLQDLDAQKIRTFNQRWHDLTYPDEAEKQRKRERLQRAIDHSKAIQELAGNPLLLTLMAILNRGEELPRDRARLYEKASEVLLYQWDVEAKLLQDPRLQKYAVEIDYRDKQAMLRRVAAKMQNSEKGLAGNFIRRDDLEQCLIDYLKTKKEAQNAPSIAAVMIDQLRERNFILCYLGADAYAFVHRTFLEYFCATEIKERFEKRGKEGGLTFEELRDEIFGQHWQDETWHEVLRLVAGMLDAQFVGDLIQQLMQRTVNRAEFLDEYDRQKKQGYINLLLAVDCLAEVRDRSEIGSVADNLLARLQREVEQEKGPHWFTSELAEAVIGAIAASWQDNAQILNWLKRCTEFDSSPSVPGTAVRAIARNWANQSQTLLWLKARVQNDENSAVRRAAVRELAWGWKDDPDTLTILKARTQNDKNFIVRYTAVEELAGGWKDAPETFDCLCDIALKDPFQRKYSFEGNPRQTALNALLTHYPNHPTTLELLHHSAINDSDEQLREWAQQQLEQREAG
jgi:energy-coupling factor transporter ATP-binding protein EcfA2